MEGIRTHFDMVLIGPAAGGADLIRIHRAGLIEDDVRHNLERDLDIEELASSCSATDRVESVSASDRKWCPGTGSNRRHCDFQSHALPTELPGHRRRA